MRLLVVGLSHRTAPIELRETVDFARGGLDVALKSLFDRGICQEAVVLSTCNRAEVYAVADTAADADALALFFSEYHQLDHRETAAHLYTRIGGDAALHLFRVAAGLDSLVVGEPQILGQVKAAYTTASDLQFTGPLLNRLFHSVVRDRQARADGNRPRRRCRVGQLRGDRAGEEDLRQAVRPRRVDPRRRRDGRADGDPSARPAGTPDDDREPHAGVGRTAGRRSSGRRRRRGRQ